MENPSFDLSDVTRRLDRLVSYGTIMQVDNAKKRARVKIGDNETGWLPWLELAAATDRTWVPRIKGEQVVVIASAGNFNQGIILGAVNQAQFPAPANSDTLHRTKYGDGAIIEYDRKNSTYHIALPENGKFLITIGTVEFALTKGGLRAVTPDVDWKKG
ncbi:MAG: phage baseplate assembly protein V [Pseudomonadota bacterium]